MADVRAGLLYADTSALVKLVGRETETDALEQELRQWSDLATSVVSSIELSRAVARARSDTTAVVADEYTVLGVLAAVAELPLSDEIRASASSLGPVELRTLDAIHLTSALALGDGLAGVLTYDKRLQSAAADHGLPVLAPSEAVTGNAEEQAEGQPEPSS